MGEAEATVKGWKQRGEVRLKHCARAALDTNCSLDWLVFGGERAQKAPTAELHKVSEPEGGYSLKVESPEQEPVYGDVLHFAKRGREVQFVLVPRYSISASAGHGRDNGHQQEAAIGEIAFEAAWMRSHFGRAGAGFALLDIAGNSMEPTLWDGETILVDLQSTEVVSGGVYVLRDGDELMVKRLQRLIGGGVEVVSDNTTFRSQVVTDRSTLTVIGRVVWPKVR